MYRTGITYKNTYNIKLINFTNDKQQVKLFRLGEASDDTPVKAMLSQRTGVNFANPYFLFVDNGDGTYTPEVKNSLTKFTFQLSDLNEVTISCGIGETLEQVNAKLNTEIANNLGGNYKQSLQYIGDGDTNEFNLFSWAIGNKLIASGIYGEFFKISHTIIGTETHKYLLQSGTSYISRNGVRVSPENNVSYAEFTESQAGSVYRLPYLDMQVVSGITTDYKDNQMFECIKFNKDDINGDDLEYFKCPVKNVFQVGNSYRFIDLETQADRFVLDGQTSIGYDLLGNSTINMNMAYNSLPNLVFGTPYGVEKALERGKEVDGVMAAGDFKKKVELDLPKKIIEEINKSKEPRAEKKKIHHPICWVQSY